MPTYNLSLPLSNIIPISVSVSPTAAPGLTFNQGLIVGPSNVIPTVGTNSPRLRLYSSIDGMLEDGFTTSSPEYLAATLYFGQEPAPTFLWVGRQNTTAIQTATVGNSGGSGYLVGDTVTTVQSGASGGQLQVTSTDSTLAATTTAATPVESTTGTAISNSNQLTVASATGIVAGMTVAGVGIVTGTTVLSVVSTTVTLSLNTQQALSSTAVTFTGYSTLDLTSASGVAVGQTVSGTGIPTGTTVTALVSTTATLSLPATTVLSSTTVTFYTNGIVTGVATIEGQQGNNYSVANNLSTTGGSGTGLTVDVTAIGETPLQSVVACRVAQPAWYACMFVGTVADSDHEAIAAFIESATPASTYFLTSGTASILNNTSGNLFANLQALNYRRTLSMYSTTQGGNFPNNVYASAAVMGIAMGLNTYTPGSYFALMFKSLAGVGYEPLTQTQVNTICGTINRSSVGLNGNVFADYQNQSYEIFQLGLMSGGTFFDQTLFTDVLINDMETSGMNLFTSLPALPITNQGVTQMINVLGGACDRSKQVGFIAPSGIWNGPNIGAGSSAVTSGQALPAGYFIYAPPVSTLSQGQRSARQLPAMTALIIEAQSGMSVVVNVDVQQ